jgi:triosephosphate isomerase
MRRKLVAGNWKMHGSLSENESLLSGILAGMAAVSFGLHNAFAKHRQQEQKVHLSKGPALGLNLAVTL